MTLTIEKLNEIYENPEQCSYSEIQEMAAMLANRMSKPERLPPADSHSVHGAGQSPIAKIGR